MIDTLFFSLIVLLVLLVVIAALQNYFSNKRKLKPVKSQPRYARQTKNPDVINLPGPQKPRSDTKAIENKTVSWVNLNIKDPSPPSEVIAPGLASDYHQPHTQSANLASGAADQPPQRATTLGREHSPTATTVAEVSRRSSVSKDLSKRRKARHRHNNPLRKRSRINLC